MLKLGEVQELTIVKQVEFGVYLAEEEGADSQERVLLPLKQVPEGAGVSDHISVFLYRDSKDRLIATTKAPALTIGKAAVLRVAQLGKIGAFLDWGLEKELLLPFREQTKRVAEGEECLVALYTDKSSRLCATMKVYPYLNEQSTYQKDDRVTGRVYEISNNFGAFVAVDDKYSGLIPQKELFGSVKVGELIQARVTGVKPDGKLDLSVRDKAYMQIDTDAAKILEEMEARKGVLDFTDRASPEQIKECMQMSKNEFKRAIGKLLKEGKIEILKDEIRLRQ